MSRFIQLHLLTAYPPANLNRDDQGSPKTAKMGGYDRLRVSSQCLKRTWRTSEIFEKSISNGIRTKMIGVDAFEKLSKFSKLSRSESVEISKNIAQVFGTLKSNSLELETLVFISHEERANIENVINSFSNGISGATEESNLLGPEIFKMLNEEIKDPINAIIEKIKESNSDLKLSKDWLKNIKTIVRDSKKADDKSPYDFFTKLIDNSNSWVKSLEGNDLEGYVLVREDQLEIVFSEEAYKLTKEVLKKLSLGATLSGAAAKEIIYGELKTKEHIKLCKEWQSQIKSWIDEVRKSDDDFLSEDNISKLKLLISPVAIAKASILTNKNTNADIALFGRMLASSYKNNIEASCQVAHAITVHPVVIEDDYFTAVEELNEYRADVGAAHIGETRFAAGLFYAYICINKELLIKNLDGNEALANQAIRALTEAAVKVAPEGKQNSFASRAYASYVLAEKGDQQPRSLSVAFLKPVDKQHDDYAAQAIIALAAQRSSFDAVYGDCADTHYELNALPGQHQGKLSELLDFLSA